MPRLGALQASTSAEGSLPQVLVRNLRRFLLIGLGLFAWSWFIGHSLSTIAQWLLQPHPPHWVLWDWSVYYAGAQDLIERDLYRVPLPQSPVSLATPVFNMPPASAAIVLPLLPLGREVGGAVWVLIGWGCLTGSALLAGRWLLWGWVWIGIAMVIYGLQPYLLDGHLLLGNVNHLILALLVAFAWAHMEGHQRAAGILLGAAVSIKLWPIMLGVLLLRERRWQELRWTVGVIVVQGAILLTWLGWDVLPAMTAALTVWLPTVPGDILWTSWARYWWGWPDWIGPVLAVVLVAPPVRGTLAIALGLLAGLGLINNIWDHYLPTFAFIVVLGLAWLLAGRYRGSPTIRKDAERLASPA